MDATRSGTGTKSLDPGKSSNMANQRVVHDGSYGCLPGFASTFGPDAAQDFIFQDATRAGIREACKYRQVLHYTGNCQRRANAVLVRPAVERPAVIHDPGRGIGSTAGRNAQKGPAPVDAITAEKR